MNLPFSAPLAAGASLTAATGPAATDADPMLDNKSSIFYPLRAFANNEGQYGSTSFPLALITLANLSPYKSLVFMWKYSDFEFSVV